MKKNKWLLLAILLFIIIIIIFLWKTYFNNKSIKVEASDNNTKIEKVYNHTFPERISTNDYFKWEFISNDIASIYPRRDALVRDILVDIWDKVNVWDTLAILFNPWVDWEWQSKINLKDTVVSTKNNLLIEAKKVKDAKVEEINQKIKEKEIILEETINNYNSKISQIGDNETLWSEYQVTLKSLENLEKNLENAESTKVQLLNESNNNIIQKENLLLSKINEIYNNIIPILYIWNNNELDYEEINTNDFSDEFWAKNTLVKNEFISKIKDYNYNFDNLALDEKYNNLIEINDLLIIVLKNTIVSVDVNETIIKNYISSINWYNSSLISQKEILEDAKNAYSVLEQNQKEKIDNIQLQISKVENELSLIWTKSISTESDKTLAVSKLNSEIETLKKSRDLLIASEDKSIVALENEISIAKAELNNEYISSWDYKIVSPFSWVISKRWIEIWEKISPSIEAFRISGVDTTLSRITKKEVKFYVPENLKDSLVMWDEISFSLWDKSASFTGSIYRISPEIDTDTLSIIAQAKVSDDIILPNKSTIRVSLETAQDIYKIPSSTIYNKAERKIIYYKKDNWKLWVRDIEIISDDGEYSLVAWNIDEELKIVTTPIFIK